MSETNSNKMDWKALSKTLSNVMEHFIEHYKCANAILGFVVKTNDSKEIIILNI